MTGYGSSNYQDESYRIFIQIKSINHRFSDITIKLAQNYMAFEIPIKNILKSRLIRGKLDVIVNIEILNDNIEVIIDNNLLIRYKNALADSINQNKLDNSILNSKNLYKLPDIIKLNTMTDENQKLEQIVLNVLNNAIDDLDATRIAEGRNLIEDIKIKLDTIENIVEKIILNEANYINAYRKKLFDNFDEIIKKSSLAEERLAIEAGIILDKICIDEELTRIKSHINQARNIIINNENEVGRKFDFLLQEFNREANTILSKSVDITLINYGIELKTLIEKIREQIQNLV